MVHLHFAHQLPSTPETFHIHAVPGAIADAIAPLAKGLNRRAHRRRNHSSKHESQASKYWFNRSRAWKATPCLLRGPTHQHWLKSTNYHWPVTLAPVHAKLSLCRVRRQQHNEPIQILWLALLRTVETPCIFSNSARKTAALATA